MRSAPSRSPRAAMPPPPVESVEDIKVRGGAGPLAARVYRAVSGTSPTVVFFHGGGWVAGDLETHDRQARWLAIETGAVVISVDYRRPPEMRFPGAFEDAFAAVRDVANRIGAFGGDAKRLGVAGDSAGGNLAAATAIACRDAGIALAAQLLVYPVTDVVRKLCRRRRERALPLTQRERRGLFPVAQRDGMVLRPLSRGQEPRARIGASRRYARRTMQDSRRRSSAPPGSIPCATKAQPMRRRSRPPVCR